MSILEGKGKIYPSSHDSSGTLEEKFIKEVEHPAFAKMLVKQLTS